MCRFSKSVFPVAAPNPPSPTPAIGCAPNVSEPRSARLARLDEALSSGLVERVHHLRLGDRDADRDDASRRVPAAIATTRRQASSASTQTPAASAMKLVCENENAMPDEYHRCQPRQPPYGDRPTGSEHAQAGDREQREHLDAAEQAGVDQQRVDAEQVGVGVRDLDLRVRDDRGLREPLPDRDARRDTNASTTCTDGSVHHERAACARPAPSATPARRAGCRSRPSRRRRGRGRTSTTGWPPRTPGRRPARCRPGRGRAASRAGASSTTRAPRARTPSTPYSGSRKCAGRTGFASGKRSAITRPAIGDQPRPAQRRRRCRARTRRERRPTPAAPTSSGDRSTASASPGACASISGTAPATAAAIPAQPEDRARAQRAAAPRPARPQGRQSEAARRTSRPGGSLSRVARLSARPRWSRSGRRGRRSR